MLGIVFSVVTGEFVYQKYIANHYVMALNVTASLPDYFYLIDKDKKVEQAKKDDVVAFYFKQKNDRYYSYDHNFIKKIACKEGETLNAKNGIFTCNKVFIGMSLAQDSKGRKVNSFEYSGVIPKDKYFMMGEARNSYDSRYWGFVKKSDIIGVSIW